MLEALSTGDKGDNSGLTDIFDRCCIPKSGYKDLQQKLTSRLLILSEDDIDSDFEKMIFGDR